MVNKSKTIPISVAPADINCEDCRHFKGRAFLHEFGCAKDHLQEKSWTFRRDVCPDNAPLRRDELIFKRFKSYFSGGSKALKYKRAGVLRTATVLRSTAVEFEKVLDTEQIAAMKQAAQAIERLAGDIDRAAELAKKHEADEKARLERERQEQLLKIAEDYFGIASGQKVAEIADDMYSFVGRAGTEWFKPISANKQGYIPLADRGIGNALHGYQTKASEDNLRDLKLRFAECLEKLQDKYRVYAAATVEDFDKFRIFRAEQREIARLAAADSTIVQLKPMP